MYVSYLYPARIRPYRPLVQAAEQKKADKKAEKKAGKETGKKAAKGGEVRTERRLRPYPRVSVHVSYPYLTVSKCILPYLTGQGRWQGQARQSVR